MEEATVLIIEDDPAFRTVTRTALEKAGFRTAEAESCNQALRLLSRRSFPIIVCDYLLADGDGISLFEQTRTLDPETGSRWILVTAQADDTIGVEAVRRGFFDFIAKPFHMANLAFRIRRALEALETSRRIEVLSRPPTGEFSAMIGSSAAMRKVFDTIRKVADKDTLVLIEGETGTGKELVARALHDLSRRKSGVFLPVNCASLAESILESELFGHEKGAFTGSTGRKPGIFEAARGGTVFLDEINSASQAVQSKLLRFLETGEFLRVGGTELVRSDARIIAASNQPLASLVETGRFRQDLFHRLNVLRITVPPLRDRPEDIPELVRHFLGLFNRKYGHSTTIDPATVSVFQQYPWPGNVRQLMNTIQSLVLLHPEDTIKPHDLPSELQALPHTPEPTPQGPFKTAKEKVLRDFETRYFLRLMRETSGNISRAAALSGLNRKNLSAKLAELGIRAADFRKKTGSTGA